MTTLQRALIAVLVLLLFAATASPTYAQQAEFTFENGFGGYSQGDGSLKVFLGKRRSLHVESRGYALTDSTFRLDQTITFEGDEPAMRYWILETKGANRYEGTLSDASGRVVARTQGSRLTLRYRITGPLFMHQTLDLLPDGRTIDNVGRIKLLGITVGDLRETIIRKNGPERIDPDANDER